MPGRRTIGARDRYQRGSQGFDATGCGDDRCDAAWKRQLDSAVIGTPAISVVRLFVGTQRGDLVAFGLRRPADPPTRRPGLSSSASSRL